MDKPQITVPLLWCLFLSFVALTNSQCPNTKDCTCENNSEAKLILYCSDEGLSAVPTFQNTNFQFHEVTLAINNIGELPANGFKTQNGNGLVTKMLDLSENPITTIDDNAFAGLEDNLEILFLHVSAMSTFPTVALQRLTKLKQLHLKGFRMSQLPSGALTSLTSLQTLQFDDCGLTSLSSSDFSSQANSLEVMDLTHNSFTEVPKDALEPLNKMKTLILAENAIDNLHTDTFSGMDSLEELNLNQNGLSTINMQAFRQVHDTLRILVLSNNNDGLHDADLDAMRILENLEELDMSYNSLTSLPSGFFQSMSRLKKLELQNNDFTGLTKEMFSGLGSSMEEINFIDNNINSIEDASFSNMPGLKMLSLDNNDLGGTYSMGTFKGLELSLMELSLTRTEFTSSHWPAVFELEKLQSLNLYKNSITNIPDQTFILLTKLSILDLGSNLITDIKQSSLRGLQNSLREIHLQTNQIATLNECVFYQFSVLSDIRLEGNPLHCDCQAKWLRKWIYDNPEPEWNEWQCNSPDQHQNKYLKDIAEADLVCDVTPTENVCEDYTSTTTTPSTTHEMTVDPTGGPNYPMSLNITAITDTSMKVRWIVFDASNVQQWQVICSDIDGGKVVYDEKFHVSLRECDITELEPSTFYSICVTPIMAGGGTAARTCSSETTGAGTGASITRKEVLVIILGAVFGGIVVIILLVVGICLFMRWRNKKEFPEFKEDASMTASRGELPQVGDNSRRFSKAKSQSLTNMNGLSTQDLDKRLDGFTPDERNRILQLFSSSGASTLSMLSTTSQRYTKEPYEGVKGRPGYLNPMQVSQELAGHNGRLDSGEYQEIPADTYDEIPIDKLGEENGAYNMPYEGDRPKSTGDILGGASNYV